MGEYKLVELLKDTLESMPGIVVTDYDGKILFLSEAYARLLNVDAVASRGKDVREVIPGTRMHIVAQTGQEEIGSLFKLKNGESAYVNRMPLRKDGRIVGAIAFSALSRTDSLTTMATMEQVRRLLQEFNRYKNDLTKLRGAKYSLEQIIGDTPGIVKIKEMIKKVAQTKSTVLITGETGTGKELVAHAIHQLSPRRQNPFIRINCAAIPADLMESELFGYEEGAFTGAKKGGRIGKFELADNGSLLLDEINQMPYYLQSKLLRVIQEKEIEKVGGATTVDVDVRLIFTTNQDLYALASSGGFREDLYYRINVVTIDLPPLRTRTEDIPLLVNNFIMKINCDHGLGISGVEPEVIKLFQSYPWPGNVRELLHVLERAANIALTGVLKMEYFENLRLRQYHSEKNSMGEAVLASARAKAEKELILSALSQTNGQVAKAATILGIHRSVLYEKMKKYGIKF